MGVDRLLPLPFSDVRIENGWAAQPALRPPQSIVVHQLEFKTRSRLIPRPTWNLTVEDRQTLQVIADHLEQFHDVRPLDPKRIVSNATNSSQIALCDNGHDHVRSTHPVRLVCTRCGEPDRDHRERLYEEFEVVRIDRRHFVAAQLGSDVFPGQSAQLTALRGLLSSPPPAVPDRQWRDIDERARRALVIDDAAIRVGYAGQQRTLGALSLTAQLQRIPLSDNDELRLTMRSTDRQASYDLRVIARYTPSMRTRGFMGHR